MPPSLITLFLQPFRRRCLIDYRLFAIRRLEPPSPIFARHAASFSSAAAAILSSFRFSIFAVQFSRLTLRRRPRYAAFVFSPLSAVFAAIDAADFAATSFTISFFIAHAAGFFFAFSDTPIDHRLFSRRLRASPDTAAADAADDFSSFVVSSLYDAPNDFSRCFRFIDAFFYASFHLRFLSEPPFASCRLFLRH